MNKVKSIRLPSAMIATLQEARARFSHTMPCIIRKAINSALTNDVVWDNWKVTTTFDDSDTVKCSLTSTQYALPGKQIAAYVNWYIQQHAQTIVDHKPFIPDDKSNYLIEDA